MTSAWITAWPRWAWMWGIAFTMYFLAKVLVLGTTHIADGSFTRRIAFLLAWPGMDLKAFLTTPSARVRRPISLEWLAAQGSTVLGIGSLIVSIQAREMAPVWRGGLGIIGIVFSLHFGLFHLLSCAWRACGVAAAPLMNAPIMAKSLSEFWGRRWNMAFRDLVNRFVFHPLCRHLGAKGALLVGFLVSGLIHDAVISLPAGGGYGLPTLYFLIQGLAILFAHSTLGRLAGLDRGLTGRLFCAVVLLWPIGWLFPRPFLVNVIVPFLDWLGEFR